MPLSRNQSPQLPTFDENCITLHACLHVMQHLLTARRVPHFGSVANCASCQSTVSLACLIWYGICRDLESLMRRVWPVS